MVWHVRVNQVWRNRLPAGGLPWSGGFILSLLHSLSANRLNQEQEDVLVPAVGFGGEVSLGHESTQHIVPGPLVAGHQSFTLALLPTVAVGGGTCPLQFTVVALVARPGTLGAATQGLGQAARATLEYVLVDMLGSCPREAARVIAADHVEWGGIDIRVGGEDH